jgi:hypothetical protein
MHKTLAAASLLAVLWVSGCLSRQIGSDGIGLRQAILDMYTDQVMDNLIRARSNMPFVQLKYSTIQANDVQDVSLNETIDHSISTASNLVTGAATRTILNDFKTVGNGDLKRTMNFTCDPITDQNDIYRKYLAFANDPGLFVCSETKPAFPVHIMRKSGKCYYWVPVEAGPAFLTLCLQTTFMRGQDAVLVPAAVVVKVADVVNVKPVSGRPIMNATLVFDKTVPNGPAALYVDLADGRSFRINLWPITLDAQNKHVDLGQPTNRLDAQWSTAPADNPPSITDLKGRSARFYSSDFPPEPGPAPPNLQEINNNLNTIRTQTQPQTTTSP